MCRSLPLQLKRIGTARSRAAGHVGGDREKGTRGSVRVLHAPSGSVMSFSPSRRTCAALPRTLSGSGFSLVR